MKLVLVGLAKNTNIVTVLKGKIRMKKPVIGITLDYHINDENFSYSAFPWYALRCDYSRVLAQMGAVPVLLSYEAEVIDDVLDNIDGLIISGGDYDIPPKSYGQDIKSEKVYTNDVRWNYEKLLLAKALERKMPFIGICNGMQVMNVLMGGTLVQDIEEQLPNAISHKQPNPKNTPYHKVNINSDTLLSTIAGEQSEFVVNSTHHQAVGALGNNLVTSAVAPDGVIEAIELSDHPFAIGLQWHVEYLTSELDQLIFHRFLEAVNKCRK